MVNRGTGADFSGERACGKASQGEVRARKRRAGRLTGFWGDRISIREREVHLSGRGVAEGGIA